MSTTRQQIALLLAEGRTPTQSARELGLALETVRYHLRRLADLEANGPDAVAAEVVPDGSAREVIPTRERVKELLNAGVSRAEIARRLGVTKPTVSYHARRLGEEIDERCARRYDWEEIQRFYDDGNSISACQARFGFTRETWNAARRRGDVVSRPRAMSLEDLLAKPRNRAHLKSRLLALGVKQNRCEICGIFEWLDRPLSMALHHVNGVRDDNRLGNLQLLCPNCHSQTENYSGRNGTRRGSPLVIAENNPTDH